PHGALYHAASRVEDQAHGIVDAMLSFERPLALLGFPGSRLLEIASERLAEIGVEVNHGPTLES
ncbi:MAG TPA: LamB/YcsF family protein, partial [Propionibacteriaceae bacterium]|nr:LamB/YcsF family protein [Propionibacteriaceae bacterium]